MIRLCRYVPLLFTFVTASVQASSTMVTSVPDLQHAISFAHAGDTITLKNGLYVTHQAITISKVGTAIAPIFITAETIGGAEISGDSGFVVASPSAYIIVRGFKFTHSSSSARTRAGTQFCRWTQNVFETKGAGESLTIAGDDHTIEYNTFQHKNSMGRFLAIRGSGSQVAQRLWIHHNYFFDFADQGGANGAESLQFGLSGLSLSNSNSIVEHNLFEKCHGENELISVKACQVTVRYNTIIDCPAQFTLRHGNRCLVYGNYFLNTPGIRIFGDDHIVHSNYFERCSVAITIGNGGGEVADGAPLVSHDRPDRVLIAFNTLVNNKQNIFQGNRSNGLGATKITVAYNIIQGGQSAAELSGPLVDPIWKGNLIFNTAGVGSMPVEGCATLSQELKEDAFGVYRPQVGSTIIDSVIESMTNIECDLDGQPRKTPLDAGADELNAMVPINHLLSKKEVGATGLR